MIHENGSAQLTSTLAAQILVQMANGGTQAPADSGSTTDTNRIPVQSSDNNAASATNLPVEEGHRPESPPLTAITSSKWSKQSLSEQSREFRY